MTRYIDILNLFICLLITLIVVQLKPIWVGFVLAIYLFIPYFLNDVLYMSDQFLYYKSLQEVINFNYFFDENPKAINTSWFLSFLPLPFAETIINMEFYNRFLFLLVFLWLYKIFFLRGMHPLFLLFYLSLVMYIFITIRDSFVMTMMVISIIFFTDKKYFLSFTVIIPSFFIKLQNFFLMIVFFKNIVLYKLKYIILCFLGFGLSFFANEIILLLDYYRKAMFREDGGAPFDYKSLEEIYELVILGISSFPYFLIKPLPLDANNTFQLIQSVENILALFFLLIFTKKAYQKDSFITIRWLFYFIITLTIYGLVVFNFGTAVRYKYPFIVIYVVGLSYELYKLHQYRFKSIFKLRKVF